MMRFLSIRMILAVAAMTLAGCGDRESPATTGAPPASRSVTLYTSADDTFAAPLLAEFEHTTGIRVDLLTDTEAAKTVGLVNRLIAEKDHPRADLFWNSEATRTAMLWERGVLSPINLPEGIDLPGPEAAAAPTRSRRWIEFAARARVLIVNTTVPLHERPSRVADLADPRWKGRVALANPLFGTTGSHMAALFDLRGEDRAIAFFTALKANEVRMLDGNAAVREAVGRGDVDVGIVDTDDALSGIERGLPIVMIWPDQEGPDAAGAFVIPNTLARVAGGPHPAEAVELIRFLLRPETEALLAAGSNGHLPVRASVPIPEGMKRLADLRVARLDASRLAPVLSERLEQIERILLR